MSSPPAGFTALTAVTAGTGTGGAAIFPYIAATVTAGTVTAAAATSTGASVSAVLASALWNPPVPVPANPAFPPLRVEAAFGYVPGDPSQGPPAWTDITSRVIAGLGQQWVNAVYGRAYELTVPESGTAAIALNNQDSALTPGNQESPFWPYVVAGVPVRVSAWWDGRWRHVCYDWAERWPQDWPDLPQWGISKMTATDAVSVTTGITMPSAVAGDVLADNPYAYFLCGEQYATTTQGLNVTQAAADAGGLIAVNSAKNNTRTGAYADALNLAAAATGQALNLAGDSGTGFGITGISFPLAASPPVSGGGIIYTDPGLPAMNSAGGLSAEFWVIIGTPQSASGYVLFQGIGQASVYGPVVPLFIWVSGSGNITVDVADGTQLTGPVLAASVTAQHIAVTLSGAPGSILNLYVNGAVAGTWSLSAAQVNSPLTALTAGACLYGYAFRPWPMNFTMGHVAFYDYELAASRVASHYATGVSGQSGMTAPARAAQILSWANLGLPRAGPATADGIVMGAAYGLGGTSAGDSLNTVAASDSGMVTAMPSGALTYLPRTALFNIAPSWTLGDDAAAAVNANPDLGPSLSPWTGYQCVITPSQARANIAPWSMLITPSGGYAFCDALDDDVAVTATATYTALAWVYSPGGWQQVTLGFDWKDTSHAYVSTSITTFAVPAGTWVLLAAQQQVPASGVAYGQIRAGMAGTPAPANLLYVSQPWMTAADEIPFTAGQGFDWDNTYLRNVTAATQVIGPDQGVTVYFRAPASQAAYFTRASSPVQTIATSEYDTYDLSTWALNKYQQSQLRVRGLTVDAASNPRAFGAVLSLRPGDVVTVNRRPVGGTPLTGTYQVQKVSHSIGPGLWTASYEMSPYIPEVSVLQLDAAGYDVLSGGALP